MAAQKESTTFNGNARAYPDRWIKNELKFFPGIQNLDQLLFPTSFAQVPKEVALSLYDSLTNDILTAQKPFGETNSARHSNVRIDMGGRMNPNRSISFFAASETKPAEVVQVGTRQNNITVMTHSTIDVDNSEKTPKGTAQLQTIFLATENEDETVQIKLRMDPEKKKLWYVLSKLSNTDKERVNLHLVELGTQGGEKIYYIKAKIHGEYISLPIPESLIPFEKFGTPQSP
jgi:hypothetical protein